MQVPWWFAAAVGQKANMTPEKTTPSRKRCIGRLILAIFSESFSRPPSRSNEPPLGNSIFPLHKYKDLYHMTCSRHSVHWTSYQYLRRGSRKGPGNVSSSNSPSVTGTVQWHFLAFDRLHPFAKLDPGWTKPLLTANSAFFGTGKHLSIQQLWQSRGSNIYIIFSFNRLAPTFISLNLEIDR